VVPPALHGGAAHAPLTADEKKAVLRRLTEVDGFERFLGRAFVGYKRFSIEGTDALVPMLDTAIDESAAAGAEACRHLDGASRPYEACSRMCWQADPR
jgi:2-oxoglutarate dehydrogenase complex dehydrogenase (E1) component-like enzyme